MSNIVPETIRKSENDRDEAPLRRISRFPEREETKINKKNIETKAKEIVRMRSSIFRRI